MRDWRPICKGAAHDLRFILPVFFIAVLASVLIEVYVPDEIISGLLAGNLYLAIPIAAVLGVLLPVPRYATYPVGFTLLMKGAGFGVVFALISGEVIGESLIVEMRYFGLRYFSVKFVLSVLFVIAGALLIEVLL